MERGAQVSPALCLEPASIYDERRPPSRELWLESPAVVAGVVGRRGGGLGSKQVRLGSTGDPDGENLC